MSRQSNTWFPLFYDAQCCGFVNPAGSYKVGTVDAPQCSQPRQGNGTLEAHQLVEKGQSGPVVSTNAADLFRGQHAPPGRPRINCCRLLNSGPGNLRGCDDCTATIAIPDRLIEKNYRANRNH